MRLINLLNDCIGFSDAIIFCGKEVVKNHTWVTESELSSVE